MTIITIFGCPISPDVRPYVRPSFQRNESNLDHGFEIIVDFAMDIDMISLANLVGNVMDEIMEYQVSLTKFIER